MDVTFIHLGCNKLYVFLIRQFSMYTWTNFVAVVWNRAMFGKKKMMNNNPCLFSTLNINYVYVPTIGLLTQQNQPWIQANIAIIMLLRLNKRMTGSGVIVI